MELELNEYLFYEFGFDLEAGFDRVARDWPFVLEPAGEVDGAPVFRFHQGGDEYYAFGGSVLDYLRAHGMTLDDVASMRRGSDWIASHNPIDFNTTTSDEGVPTILERRRQFGRLVESAFPSPPRRILEAVLLRRSGQYLGVIEDAHKRVWALGSVLPPVELPFPDASAWRRLAWAVGRDVDCPQQ